MATTNFKNIVITLAIGLTLVSCGGNSKKQKAETATSESSSSYNPKEHFTAVKVNIDFIEDWMLPTDGVITEVEFEDAGLGIYRIRVDGISKAQCEKYEKMLESKGMVFGFDACNNGKVVIDFTKTFLKDSPEKSILTLRFYKR